MNSKNNLYLAVLVETENNFVCIAAVTKTTWDTRKLLDHPDDIEDIVSNISLPGYELESSGMDYSFLDIITKDGEDLIFDDVPQLIEDLIKEGYTVNQDFSKHLEDSSVGLYVSV